MHSAFPIDERRDDYLQRELADSEPKFHSCAILSGDSNDFVGLLSYWDFNSYIYIEHFAIDSEMRNCGLGGDVLSQFIKEIGLPVVLEVELPTDHLSSRRIDFYTRHGFSLWETIPYIQPPYRKGGEELPMHLMAYGAISPLDAVKVIASLRRYVYRCND